MKLLRGNGASFLFSGTDLFFLQELAVNGNISLDAVYSKLVRMLPFAATKYLLQKSIELLQEAAYLELRGQEILTQRSSDYCSF